MRETNQNIDKEIKQLIITNNTKFHEENKHCRMIHNKSILTQIRQSEKAFLRKCCWEWWKYNHFTLLVNDKTMLMSIGKMFNNLKDGVS